MRAAIYVRVSDPSQEDGTSLETQTERCLAYCAERGWEVTAVYREVMTGVAFWERRELARLLAATERGEHDAVVFYSVDRLSRDPAHLAAIRALAERYGVTLACVTEPIGESDEDWLIFSVRGYAAKREWRQIVERTLRGRLARVRNGKPLTSGKPPYGYRWVDAAKTRCEVEPNEARIVQRIYARTVDGASYRRIAHELNADGIPSPFGSIWRPSSIRVILSNPAYRGEGIAGYWARYKSRQRHRLFSEAIPLPDVYPAIVDPKTWEAAQRENARPISRFITFLQGFVYCGYCGRKAFLIRMKSGARAFRCGSANDPKPRAHTCRWWTIRVDLLEAIVWERITRVLLDPDVIRSAMCAFLADDRIDADYELVLAAIAKLEREQANLARALALLDDARAQAPILARLKEIADEIETLRHDLRTIEGRRARRDAMLARADDLATWCEHVRAELPTLAPEERRWALEAFGARILVFSVDHGERVRILGLPEEALTVPMDTTSNPARPRRTGCFK